MSDFKERRRWISLGEVIALAALIVSALGLWITWQGSREDKPTRIVEQKQAIPLVLRASAEREGRALIIEPVETSHALESLSVTLPGHPPIDVGSDGRLSAADVEKALGAQQDRKGAKNVRIKIAVRYVEAGAERQVNRDYLLNYRWDGGGLFGGKSVRLVGLSR